MSTLFVLVAAGLAVGAIAALVFKKQFIGLLKGMFGDFTKEELKKYLLLGLIFAFIIGTYWTMRSLKDAIFGAMVVGHAAKGGVNYLAWAKVVSLFLLIPVIIGYTKLVDKFSANKHRLFYAICLTYVVLLAAWAGFFLLPGFGLANTVASPWRIAGWLWYVFVESFGSIVVALFWAFTTDISDAQSSKKGFSLIVMIAQLGGIIFPRLTKLPSFLSTTNWIVVAVCAGLVFVTYLLMRYFIAIMPAEQLKGYKAKEAHVQKEEPGFFEGLKLMLTHKYLLGIFGVLAIFEIIVTIIDNNFKTLAFAQFTDANALTVFLGNYSSAVNFVAFLCLLFGINNVQRKLGIRTALALVPLIVGGAFLTFYFYPNVHVLFYIMIGAKAINYALNGPSLKQLYVPTTEDAKYKSQAWIETFGSRSSKTSASFFNMTKSFFGYSNYLFIALILSMGLVGLWFVIALYLGATYNKAVEKGSVVC